MNLRPGTYAIEENENYPKGEGNLFLMTSYHAVRGVTEYCIGGADIQPNGEWDVTISSDYDEETDSDAAFVGSFGTQQDAWKALWDSRFQAV